MEKSKVLVEILKKIILEIRLLSSSENRNSSMDQINKLANIAHNIPAAIIDDEKFDIEMLKRSLREYGDKYPSSGVFESFLEG